VSRISAREALLAIADPDSLTFWDAPFTGAAPVPAAYAAQLADAERASGADESVLAGELHLGGVRAAALAWEFGFLGGSVGVATAARIVATIRRATAEGLPLLALPRSGGTRMQEGAPAFIQMVAITAALAEHRAAGLPYLVHLCSPTTGGVLATLGSAGDLTSAEPGAMVGFLGPRAFAAITGEAFPEGVQVAEHLVAHGVLDLVLDWPALRATWASVLGLWADRGHTSAAVVSPPVAAEGVGVPPPGAPGSAEELWRYVAASRAHDRIDAAQFIAAHMTDVVALPGTAAGEVGRGALVALGRLEGMPLVVAATEDRWTGEPLTAAGLRTVRRGIALAARWGLPMLTIVDTLGAALSVQGEESGIAGEISRVMLDLVASPSPTAALLLGAGTGGAALALLATDGIVAASHAWVSPLAPEGAAAIRHGLDLGPAEVAWEQQIGVHALGGHGFVDVIVRESEPDWVATAAHAVVASLLDVRAGTDPGRRMERFAAWSTDPSAS
jgi:acetyl-CoA carboxylase carboxyl transferase subunit beta